MQFAHLAQRLFNVPLAIHPAKAEVVMAALAERLGITRMMRMNGDAIDLIPMALEGDGYSYAERGARDTGYDLLGNIAVIPVHGTLVQKTGSLRPWSGMTGYDGIRQAFLTALNDPQVTAIVLDIDSPGGEVAGAFDLVDTIYTARGSKPIWSILNEVAYSAAYAIASAGDRIHVPRTGGTGSIGVITMHVDFSKALTAAGLQVTFIAYGDRKTDGHGEIPLAPEAYDRFKADIDTMGELFVDTVARNRNIAASKVRGTQALTYLGSAGVGIGLADAVAAPDAAFRALLAELA
ncbi:signal peptide peptidase SppA [Pseudomonas nitritireducens]|uniref:Signal peptide peptidase SppA n=1 Tax=Pseudomonas nitroreducens TaxID=46680 RepID=A0A7W7KJP4_PSENT|nr:S49 family peptidase [Pseudomonas nitritireducens]MBB4863343.1 signal peptide peptidase SppA [Pseudomonas nitritireducens]